jgi:hypothetical protein
MNKYELLTKISALLDQSIEAHEVTDLKLEAKDNGSLCDINSCLDRTIDVLRRARRSGRVLLEEYEYDLTKKPEYIDLDDSIGMGYGGSDFDPGEHPIHDDNG